jgi:hypothetical protein
MLRPDIMTPTDTIPGAQPAVGALASTGTTSGGDQNTIAPDLDVVDQQTSRRQ